MLNHLRRESEEYVYRPVYYMRFMLFTEPSYLRQHKSTGGVD